MSSPETINPNFVFFKESHLQRVLQDRFDSTDVWRQNFWHGQNSRAVGPGGLPISEIRRESGAQDAADGEAEETPHLGSRSAHSRRSASMAPTGAGGPHGRSDLARRAPRPCASFRGALLRSGCGAQVRRLRGAAALDGAHPPPRALRLVPQHLRQWPCLLGPGLPAPLRLPEPPPRPHHQRLTARGRRAPLLPWLRIYGIVRARPSSFFCTLRVKSCVC